MNFKRWIAVNPDDGGWNGPIPSNPAAVAHQLERQATAVRLAAVAGVQFAVPRPVDVDDYVALLTAKAAALRAHAASAGDQAKPTKTPISTHQRRMALAAASFGHSSGYSNSDEAT